MDLQDLSIFVRVAAVQNLSAVGTELGLTPGTISKRIQSLEEELEVRLFDRTTRSIRITEEGQRFLVHADRVLNEIEQARAAVSQSSDNPVGKLKIAAPDLLGRTFVTPAVLTFRKLFPGVDVQLDLTDRTVNLHEEGYDIAIHAGSLADSALIAKKLAPDRTLVVASPAYISEHGAPQSADDLQRHSCLALSDVWTWSMPNAKSAAEEAVRLNVRFRSNSSEVLRRAALQGIGLMQTTARQIGCDLKSGRLVPVLSKVDDVDDIGIYALFLNGRQELPRLRMFLDHLAEYFRDPRLTEFAGGDAGNAPELRAASI
ncbi:MAG: LysR family transcriptional regulator [Hyphomicrobiaceae bacterium]|nr:LysR family transcriptional regulator [Hyphomicrobiaceae bacterium]